MPFGNHPSNSITIYFIHTLTFNVHFIMTYLHCYIAPLLSMWLIMCNNTHDIAEICAAFVLTRIANHITSKQMYHFSCRSYQVKTNLSSFQAGHIRSKQMYHRSRHVKSEQKLYCSSHQNKQIRPCNSTTINPDSAVRLEWHELVPITWTSLPNTNHQRKSCPS